MKKAIAYKRISTKDQSNFSIAGQETSICEFANRRSIEVVACFTDEGKSAKNFDRPDWKNLEIFIQKHYRDIDYLLVVKYDRFSRNAAEGLQKIELLERKYNIIILSVFEEMYIDYDSPFFFKQRADMLVNAEFELHVIRDRTKFGNHQARITGRFINRAPWGYKNSRDTENKPIIEIIPEKLAAIKLIYSLYLSGCSFKQISVEAQKAGGKYQGHSAIKRILGNPTYAGLILVPAYRKDSERYVKALHEPMIEEHLWWQVQRQIGNVPKPRTVENEEVPLRGELHCFCNKLMTAGNSRSKSGKYYWYYKCNTHLEQNFPAIKLHSQFDEVLEHLSLPEFHIHYLRQAASKELSVRLESSHNEIARMQRELFQTQKNLDSAEEKFITGSLAADSYRKWYSKYTGDITSLRHRIGEAESFPNEKINLMEQNLFRLSDIKGLYYSASLTQKKIFLRQVFNYGLSYWDGIYRTPYLHPLLSHNQLILKEKGLLIVEQPSEKLSKNGVSTPTGNLIELSSSFIQFVAEIKTA